MKKVIVALAILAALGSKAQAAAIGGDLFPYQNYTATFTRTMDMGEMSTLSAQVAYSTAVLPSGITVGQTGIDVVNDVFTSSYTYGAGQQILLVVTSSAPTGLVGGTTYFAIPVTATLFKVSDTSTGAVAGVALDITATSTTTLAIFNPLALSVGAAGITWDASNDGTNFSTVGSSCTLTAIASGGSNQIRDFGAFNYRYLRMSFSGVTTGTMKLRVYLNGRRQ